MNTNQNIVIINDYANVNGGASKVAIASALGLDKLGFSVIFIYGGGEVASELVDSNIKLHDLNQHDLLSNPSKINAMVEGLFNANVYSKLDLIFRDLDKSNTVINVHSWTKSISSSFFSVAKKHQLKVLITLHDYFTACPNGALFNFQTNTPCSLRPMSYSCLLTNCDARNYSHKLWRYARGLIQKFYLNDNNVDFISISDFSENKIRTSLSLNKRFYRVDNPISVYKKRLINNLESNYFIYVGRLEKEKGVELLIDVAKQSDFKILVVGSGSLENRLAQEGNIELLGWKTNEEVFQLISGARALIFPSIIYETMGLTILEALSLGVPVIVSNTCAGSDYVVEGKNGFTFDTSSSASLIGKMKILQNELLLEKIKKTAHEIYWATPKTIEAHTAQCISAFKAIKQ